MTGTEPATEPELSNEQYADALRELARQFPAPTWGEVQPDWQWVHGRMEDGSLDPQGRWRDRHIAVLDRTVVGVDTNPLRLRTRLSRELGVHPERLIVTYLY